MGRVKRWNTATENTEVTERGEKNQRTEQIVGAAIEVHLNLGCPRLADGIYRTLCVLCALCGKKEA